MIQKERKRKGGESSGGGKGMADSVVAGWLIEIGLQDVIPIFREVAALSLPVGWSYQGNTWLTWQVIFRKVLTAKRWLRWTTHN